MKKAISAKIDVDTLTYIKGCKVKVNTLINSLLKEWSEKRQKKELLLWKEETGQDEFSQMKANNNIKCSQCCSNCIYSDKTWCKKNDISLGLPYRPKMKFCCIHWEKKKGSN